jgi:hypothetical protein
VLISQRPHFGSLGYFPTDDYLGVSISLLEFIGSLFLAKALIYLFFIFPLDSSGFHLGVVEFL